MTYSIIIVILIRTRPLAPVYRHVISASVPVFNFQKLGGELNAHGADSAAQFSV